MADDRQLRMSVLCRYLVIQAMTLVCGIVGPIFLIMYFATQPDPTIKWMYWAGLFITAADVLIALAITHATMNADNKVAQAVERRRRRAGP